MLLGDITRRGLSGQGFHLTPAGVAGTTAPMEQLTTWLTDENLTHDGAAALFGVSTATLRGWLYEGKVPRDLSAIQRVKVITKGRVRLEDWAAVIEARGSSDA